MPDPNDTLKPMSDGDIETPPAGTGFEPATPLKNAGVAFEPSSGATPGDADAAQPETRFEFTRQSLKDNAQKLQAEAGDRARGLAEQGKSRAGDALGQVSQMLNDAALQVDDKVGAQYGQYARSAATQVQDFADQLNAKSIDEILDDVRVLVRKSPGVAIGAAAAVGFVVARLLTAGLDQQDRS